MALVVVVDYGMGNLRSVAQALRAVAPPSVTVKISNEAADIAAASRLVLPGQGAMRDCMKNLAQSGLQTALLKAAETKPLLGVCVGEQMLLTRSDEGGIEGLNLIAGDVKRFENGMQHNGEKLKVPHMGWNEVFHNGAHPIMKNIQSGERFYFVHSYYCAPSNAVNIAATSDYGISFCAAIQKENIFATQFHPEKSAQAGLQLYKNFLDWQP